MKQPLKKELHVALLVCMAGILGALNYEIFVFQNKFSPAGLNGILTMVQYLFHFSFGYMSLVCNIPLILFAYFKIDKEFALKNAIYVVCFSVASIILRNTDVSNIAFKGLDAGERALAAIAAGVFNGLLYSVTMKNGGSTGGIDIIARFVNKKHPEYNFIWIIFALNAIVVSLSFIVYGRDFVAAILCIIYCFVTSRISDYFIKGSKSAAEYEVITKNPESLANEIMGELKHGCTVVKGTGMYSHSEVSLLICVVNKMQINDFERIIKRHQDAFVIVSSVNGTYGNFKHVK